MLQLEYPDPVAGYSSGEISKIFYRKWEKCNIFDREGENVVGCTQLEINK